MLRDLFTFYLGRYGNTDSIVNTLYDWIPLKETFYLPITSITLISDT
jgi:hypothetical protein